MLSVTLCSHLVLTRVESECVVRDPIPMVHPRGVGWGPGPLDASRECECGMWNSDVEIARLTEPKVTSSRRTVQKDAPARWHVK